MRTPVLVQKRAWFFLLTVLLSLHASGSLEDTVWQRAAENGEIAREALVKSLRFVHAWLQTADPETGLIPRNLKDSPYWNAKDSAADNYPFMVLTTYFTDRTLFDGRMKTMLETEQRLCNRLGRLPDDWLFEPQGFRVQEVRSDDLIFGASEYMKDGLIPVTELLGPSPWSERMLGMLEDLWAYGAVETEIGRLPSTSHEVAGNLLQLCSRIYWMTGEEIHRRHVFQLGDYFFLHHLPTETERLQLDDHGCEVINGLSEAYFVAAKTDPEKHAQWRKPMHAMLDRILETARDENGLLYDLINPKTGEIKSRELTDNWGYNYNAFAVVAEVDGEERYAEAVRHVLSNLPAVKDYRWEYGSADGYADSLEGGLNLLNRYPVAEAAEWADYTARILLDKPRDTGIVEGWHGDGNFARTALMYAFWKSQGAWLHPWRNDLRLGAVSPEPGTWCFHIASDWHWQGAVNFDLPRHAVYLHMPEDYPRLNQFPEWFVIREDQQYALQVDDNPVLYLRGKDLSSLPLRLTGDKPRRIILRENAAAPAAPPVPTESVQAFTEWQQETRKALFEVLRITDLTEGSGLPLEAAPEVRTEKDGFVLCEVEIQGLPGHRLPAVLGLPAGEGPFPAVVCIHGHGDTRYSVFEEKPESAYKGIGARLAKAGYVTMAVDVGGHEALEVSRELMGERLWNLMRCVDYLTSLKMVDPKRIGCAGLSLGGEMSLWLAATDTRIRAAVSGGFLTLMDQMEQNHCMCWKFPGLRSLVDYPGLASLAAPRSLQFQNGMKEPDNQFPPWLARLAFRQIQPAYACLDASDRLFLHVHPGGHELDYYGLLRFFDTHLK